MTPNDFDPMVPAGLPPAPAALGPAPGAKAARVCGILAILFALTCIGFPVALVLGIVALVQQGKAKRAAQAEPGRYETPTATGLVTGIVGLVLSVLAIPVGGIAAAIAVPAVLAQRETAREKALKANVALVKSRAEMLVLQMKAEEHREDIDADRLIERLLLDPELARLRNPCDPSAKALERGESPSAPGIIALMPWKTDEEGEFHVQVALEAKVSNRDGVTAITDFIEVFSVSHPAPAEVPSEPPAEAPQAE